jgi:hypothetical protein
VSRAQEFVVARALHIAGELRDSRDLQDAP